MALYYVTFATTQAPAGACVVAANDSDDAIEKTIRMRIAPNEDGMMGIAVKLAEDMETHPATIQLLNRLIGPDELRSMGGRTFRACIDDYGKIIKTEERQG